jgi:hypothetical protein
MIKELLCSECSEKWSDFRKFKIEGRKLTCDGKDGCGATFEYEALPENNKYSSIKVISHGKAWKGRERKA